MCLIVCTQNFMVYPSLFMFVMYCSFSVRLQWSGSSHVVEMYAIQCCNRSLVWWSWPWITTSLRLVNHPIRSPHGTSKKKSKHIFFNFISDLMSGWWIIEIQPDLLMDEVVFAANSTHPLPFLQFVEHLWITGSPHIDNLTESTSIGSRWIHVVGWNHVRGGKLLGMPSGYAQFWESMVHLPAPMFLFWCFFSVQSFGG